MSPIGLDTMGTRGLTPISTPIGVPQLLHTYGVPFPKKSLNPMVSSPNGLFTMGYHLFATTWLLAPIGAIHIPIHACTVGARCRVSGKDMLDHGDEPFGARYHGDKRQPTTRRALLWAQLFFGTPTEVILQKQKRCILCFSLTSTIKGIIIRVINIATEYLTHERIIFCIFAKYLSHLTWNT